MKDQIKMQTQAVNNVEVLLFDIGGTVFDWRAAIVDAIKSVDADGKYDIDAADFADHWRQQSLAKVEAMARGDAPWRPFDQILQTTLDTTLIKQGCSSMSQLDRARLIAAWDALPAWPDIAEPLRRLRQHYFIAPYTILSLRATAFSSKKAGIDWDAIISCDALQAYKLDSESYRRALRSIGKSAEQVCFVASHPGDLRAAKAAGMRTAYLQARLEDKGECYDEGGYQDEFDLVAKDWNDLAQKLGCA